MSTAYLVSFEEISEFRLLYSTQTCFYLNSVVKIMEQSAV